MKKYDQYTAADKIDAHLHDNDIHYLTGEISQDNVEEAIKWILSANLSKKPKKTLKLYINTVGGDLYESFACINILQILGNNVVQETKCTQRTMPANIKFCLRRNGLKRSC